MGIAGTKLRNYKGGFAFPRIRHNDEKLQTYLNESGIQWRCLDEAEQKETEAYWRTIFGLAFRGRPRLRNGTRAEHEYQLITDCTHYLIVPFTSGVVHFIGQFISAYECWGSLVPLGAFCGNEFFICPIDFSWTMVHDHEDHAFGGPYFLRTEWIP
jgi:hypothetical protein